MLPILLALAFMVVLLVVVVAGRPDEFVVSRRTEMSAPPEQIFPHVNELRHWEGWNPWGKLDPNCRMNYGGPSAGTGASYTWDGNHRVGAGRVTIIESDANERVCLRLEFTRPMKATNIAEFAFQSKADGTVVTWTMSGRNNFIGKVFGLFVDCDKMCGSQFEKGLAQMKSLVEAEVAA